MDFDYEMIAWCDDPRDIEDVSMMRHYVNCHGITDKLQKFMNCSFVDCWMFQVLGQVIILNLLETI